MIFCIISSLFVCFIYEFEVHDVINLKDECRYFGLATSFLTQIFVLHYKKLEISGSGRRKVQIFAKPKLCKHLSLLNPKESNFA